MCVGKTSFLNVLAGRSGYAHVTGTISINHIPCSITRLRSYAGFVPQDDILHPDLTVYENLYYSAMLRLPRTMKRGQKARIIEDVIEMLGLGHVRDSRVGSVEKRGISGGQRKRVNIGTELVANPSLLFMDEPTSGLDASAALEVLSSLRRLADLGLTIITVVHQPRYSIFSSFHTVMFLGQGGQTVYLGRTEEAMSYFESLGFDLPENENPADYLMVRPNTHTHTHTHTLLVGLPLLLTSLCLFLRLPCCFVCDVVCVSGAVRMSLAASCATDAGVLCPLPSMMGSRLLAAFHSSQR